MKRLVQLGIVLGIGLLPFALTAGTLAVADSSTTCTADLVLSATNPGTGTTADGVTTFRGVSVTGTAILSLPDGPSVKGSVSGVQDVRVNSNANTLQVQGELTGTSKRGTVTLRYTGSIDLNTGTGTGQTATVAGTGDFANFHGEGRVTAKLIGPLAVQATGSGPCQTGA